MARKKMQMIPSAVSNGVNKNAKKQQKNIQVDNKKNANKLKIKKNLKRAIEETVKEAPNKVHEKKSKTVAGERTISHSLHRVMIYYHSQEAAATHYNEIKKNMKELDIQNIVHTSANIDKTTLKIFVGYKAINDKQKEELLKITKAKSVQPASRHSSSLSRLLLLKYDDAEVAKQIIDKGSFNLRNYIVTPSYAQQREHENNKGVKQQQPQKEEIKPQQSQMKVEKKEKVPKVEEEDEDDDMSEEEDEDEDMSEEEDDDE